MNNAMISRILIALDASPESLAALETAAVLAGKFHAELAGVFVEDVELLQVAALPFTREVNRLSGQVNAVDEGGMTRQFKMQAKQAQRALEKVALHSRVRYSFQVVRGGVSHALVAATRAEDLLMLGRKGWSLGQRLGSTAQALLMQAHCLTLLHKSKLPHRMDVGVVYDGSSESEKALQLGVQIGVARDLYVIILAPNDAVFLERQKQVSSILTAVNKNAEFRRGYALEDVGLMDAQDLLLLPATQKETMAKMLGHLDCSVMLIR